MIVFESYKLQPKYSLRNFQKEMKEAVNLSADLCVLFHKKEIVCCHNTVVNCLLPFVFFF